MKTDLTNCHHMKPVSLTRVRAAYAVAICTDVIQIVLFPLFWEGGLSPLEIALDLVACSVITALVGWHIAFIPTFLIELVPGVDLAPTWTIAVIIATRGRQMSAPESAFSPDEPRDDKGRPLEILNAGDHDVISTAPRGAQPMSRRRTEFGDSQ
ncbi:MAG: hypothetical protein KA236_01510 [Verrucomicrobia bacterium]|jgi:hypothetical protein|nr:hypothetical protein [Verrucomicrobiota bacterium]